MKISYAITVCNEVQEFKRLLDFLIAHIREEDEIVVLVDGSKGKDREILELTKNVPQVNNIAIGQFEGDFANWKNILNSYCTGEYIFQLDADEVPVEELTKYLPVILASNPEVDLFFIPRKNRVEGLTDEDIRKWGWRVQDGLVNWPDYQGRIYKNLPQIKWQGKVHEKIVGVRTYGHLPDMLYLEHDKTITKQRAQNALYSQIQNEK